MQVLKVQFNVTISNNPFIYLFIFYLYFFLGGLFYNKGDVGCDQEGKVKDESNSLAEVTTNIQLQETLPIKKEVGLCIKLFKQIALSTDATF